MNTRLKRINKTHQKMEGVLHMKQAFTDNLELEVDFYRQDGGGWHPYVKRFFKKACTEWFTDKGFFYGFKKTFVPSLPDGCPFKPAVYNLTPLVITRYRKDWDEQLQFLIPPMVPASDKWRVDTKIYGENMTFTGMLRLDVRLINKFMSQ